MTSENAIDDSRSPAEIATEDFSFASADGTSTVSARLWFPQGSAPGANARPQGIVHIVHGMSEYIRRYDDFARYLAGRASLFAART